MSVKDKPPYLLWLLETCALALAMFATLRYMSAAATIPTTTKAALSNVTAQDVRPLYT